RHPAHPPESPPTRPAEGTEPTGVLWWLSLRADAGSMMKRAVAQRPTHVGFRGVLALLVAVVALLCVFGHAERGGPGPPPSAAQHVHAPTASEGSGGTAAPCGKKVLVDHSAQRAESVAPTASRP